MNFLFPRAEKSNKMEAKGTEGFKIEKLGHDNYNSWAFQVKLLLERDEALDVIEGTAPIGAEDLIKWNKKERKALQIIGLNVDRSQLIHITKCKTGSEAWKALKEQHKRDTLGAKIRLMRSLFNIKLGFGASMREHLNQITKYLDELHDMGEELKENIQLAIIMSSLNRDYDNLVTGLETWEDGKLKLHTVKSKLLEEWEKREAESSSQTTGEARAADNRKKFLKCHLCGKTGHFRYECNKRDSSSVEDLREKLNKSQAKMARYNKLYSLSFNTNCDWVIDSGATQHMVKEKSSFEKLDQTFETKVITANGEEISVRGKGIIKLPIHTRNGPSHVEFSEVLWIPDLKDNLISVAKLVERGKCDVVFDRNYCTLRAGRSEDMRLGVKRGDAWVLNLERCYAATTESELCIHEWHKRLAHRNLSDIRLMEGLKINACEHSDDCESCLKGKMSRKPFPKKALPTKEVLDCVVSDVCGPLQVESLGKKRYFLSFVDIHSRFCKLYFIREKSEVPQKTMEYIEFMKTQIGRKPKVLRTDRGTEYMNHTLQEYLKNEGIKFQCTVGYAPEQNGVAERKNRTIMEAVRSMLAESGLPKSLWAEAADTANFTFNRLVNRNTKKSPYETIFKKKPRDVKFYEFGTDAYVMVPYEKRRKLDDKALKMKFVGYDESSKGYRLVDQHYKVHVSREVKFLQTNCIRNDKSNLEVPCNGFEEPLEKLQYPDIDENEFYFCENDEDEIQEVPEIQGVPEIQEVPEIENQLVDEEEDEVFHDVRDEDNDIFEEVEEDEEQNVIDDSPRRSRRENFGKMPERLNDYEVYQAKVNDFEPRNYKEAISCKESSNWIKAMEEELQGIERNNTWELVNLPYGARAVGSRWVYKVKKDHEGNVTSLKARLVAQGFSQRFGVDYNDVFAPVARTTTWRLLLSISGDRDYRVSHYDIKTAFLNGTLEEEIYLKPPPGYERGNQVYKLKKSLYGLKQAANVWNKTLHNSLVKNGCEQDNTDKCLYKKVSNGKICYLLVHVDDMLVATNDEKFREVLMKSIGEDFELKDLGQVKHYLGIEVDRTKDGEFLISQTAFIDKIVKEAGLEEAKIQKNPIDLGYFKLEGTSLESNEEYRTLIGMLLYLSTNTRPDIAASVSILSQKVTKPRDVDLTQVKRLIRYIKGTRDRKLRLNVRGKSGSLQIYSDANWAEDPSDRKSNSGFICMLNGGTISWCCRKQNVVALSSTEAEYIALTETCKEVVWLKEVSKCFDFDKHVFGKIKIYTDNQSCMAIVKNENFSNRTKHIDARYHFIRNMVTEGKIYLEYVPTETNVADLLTKPLGPARIESLRKLAGMIDCKELQN